MYNARLFKVARVCIASFIFAFTLAAIALMMNLVVYVSATTYMSIERGMVTMLNELYTSPVELEEVEKDNETKPSE